MTIPTHTDPADDRYVEDPCGCSRGTSPGGDPTTDDCCAGHGQHKHPRDTGHHCQHRDHHERTGR